MVVFCLKVQAGLRLCQESMTDRGRWLVQAAHAVRRMARLLYALHLLLEDDVLAAALSRRPQEAPGSLPQLAGLLHGALQDMAAAFPQHAPVPSGNLHGFLKVLPILHVAGTRVLRPARAASQMAAVVAAVFRSAGSQLVIDR